MDDWDIVLTAGLFFSGRISIAVEEHGSGKQLVRGNLKIRPKQSGLAIFSLAVLFLIVAVLQPSWIAIATTVLLFAVISYQSMCELSYFGRVLTECFQSLEGGESL